MKQHITIEQLHEYIELEFDGEKITGFNPTKYRMLCKVFNVNAGRPLTAVMITIGKMIEVLEERGIDWYNWIFDVNYDHEIGKGYDGELCDTLWYVVKKILEGE